MSYDDQIPEDEYTLVGNQAPHETVIAAPLKMLRPGIEARGAMLYDADADVWIPFIEVANAGEARVDCRMMRLPNGDLDLVLDLDSQTLPLHTAPNDLEVGGHFGVMGRLTAYIHGPDDDDDGDEDGGNTRVVVRR